MDTSYDEDMSLDVLLISCGNVFHKCFIPSQPSVVSQIKQLDCFNTCWPKKWPLYMTLSDQKIKLYKDYNLISEVQLHDQQLVCTTFSLCGNNLFYALSDGRVYLYHYKSKRNDLLMNLAAPVLFIKCLKSYDDEDNASSVNSNIIDNGILVAAAENGCIELHWENKNNMKRSKTFPVLPKAVFLHGENYLIVVHVDLSVSLWNLLSNDVRALDNGYKDVSQNRYLVGFSEVQSLLATITNCDVLEVFSFDSDQQKLIRLHNESVEKSTCLCFSFDGKLLAVGHQTGNITVSVSN